MNQQNPPFLVSFGIFLTWDEVLAHVKAGEWTFYQAPLDYRPSSVIASVRGNGRKVRIAGGPDHDGFWADEKHLDRFRKRVTV